MIEMVWGCTRVTVKKEAITSFFGKPLSVTLNQDEAIAGGCTFSGAILSSVFHIPDEDTSLTVFKKGNILPSTKILTFDRRQPFELEARYVKPDALPGKVNAFFEKIIFYISTSTNTSATNSTPGQ